MKQYAFRAALALILGLATFGMSDAQRRGPGRGLGGPAPFLGISGVELTDAQRQQIKALFDEERASQDPRAGVNPHVQLRAELLADSPDEQKVVALRDQIAAAQAERLTREIALQQKIAALLTPEQRAQAREALANASERRGAGRRGAGSTEPRW